MDLISMLQLVLFCLSGLYFYFVLPLGIYLATISIIKEIKKPTSRD